MRLNTSIWVGAYLRRCESGGAFAAVERKGMAEAGMVFIKVVAADRSATIYGPAPQTDFSDQTRRFTLQMTGDKEADADAYLARQVKYDPDLWIIAVEDRDARHFLETGSELVIERPELF